MHLVGVVDDERIEGKEDRVILLGAFAPLVVDHQLTIYHIFELDVLLFLWLLTSVMSLYVEVGDDSSEVVLTVDQEPNRFLLDSFAEIRDFTKEEANTISLLADNCLPRLDCLHVAVVE